MIVVWVARWVAVGAVSVEWVVAATSTVFAITRTIRRRDASSTTNARGIPTSAVEEVAVAVEVEAVVAEVPDGTAIAVTWAAVTGTSVAAMPTGRSIPMVLT